MVLTTWQGSPLQPLRAVEPGRVGRHPPSRCRLSHKAAAAWWGSPWPSPRGARTAPAQPALQAPVRPSGHSPSRSCPKLYDAPKPWPPEPRQPQILLCRFHAQNTLWECQERPSDIPLKQKKERLNTVVLYAYIPEPGRSGLESSLAAHYLCNCKQDTGLPGPLLTGDNNTCRGLL